MCMRYRLFCISKALHGGGGGRGGIILEITSSRRVDVVIIKASYFEVFIGVTHKVVTKALHWKIIIVVNA